MRDAVAFRDCAFAPLTRDATDQRICRIVVTWRRCVSRLDERVEQGLVVLVEALADGADISLPLLERARARDDARHDAVVEHPVHRVIDRAEPLVLGVRLELARDLEGLFA